VHHEHVEEPAVLKFPARQALHAVAATPLTVPAAHGAHAAAVDEPVFALRVPLAHSVRSALPRQ